MQVVIPSALARHLRRLPLALERNEGKNTRQEQDRDRTIDSTASFNLYQSSLERKKKKKKQDKKKDKDKQIR
jgi:hypothetical protein